MPSSQSHLSSVGRVHYGGFRLAGLLNYDNPMQTFLTRLNTRTET